METRQLFQYLPVLMLIVFAVAVVGGMMLFSVLVGKRGKRFPVKDSAYECGMVPITEGVPPMPIRFYRTALLFVLFDIEVIFLYPYAVVYKEMLKTDPTLTLVAMLSFIGILFVGFLYALKKGALQFIR